MVVENGFLIEEEEEEKRKKRRRSRHENGMAEKMSFDALLLLLQLLPLIMEAIVERAQRGVRKEKTMRFIYRCFIYLFVYFLQFDIINKKQLKKKRKFIVLSSGK